MGKDYFFDVTLVIFLLLMLGVQMMPEIAVDLLRNICAAILFVLVAIIVVRESLLLRDGFQTLCTEWRITASVRFILMIILCIVSVILTLSQIIS